jgi:hypothetical protein
MHIAPLDHIEVGVDPIRRSFGLSTGIHVVVFRVDETRSEIEGVFYHEGAHRIVVDTLIHVDGEWRFKRENSSGMLIDGIPAYEPAVSKLRTVLANAGHKKFRPKHSK